MMILKIKNKFWQLYFPILIFILLFFDPDFILSKGFVGGLEVNYLDIRLRFEGVLLFVILVLVFKNMLNIPLGVYLVWILGTIARSSIPFGWGIYKFLNIIFLFVGPLFLMYELIRIKKSESIKLVKRILFGLGFLGVIVAILQVFGGNMYLNSRVHSIFVKLGEPLVFKSKVVCCANFFPRAYGFLPHPNILSFISLIFMSFLIYLEKGFTFRVVPFILLVILSMSKVGFAVLLLILLIYLTQLRFTLKKFKWLLFLSLILGLVAPFLIWYGGVLGLNKYYFFKTRNIAFNYFISVLNLKRLFLGIGFLNYFDVLIKQTKLVVYNGVLFMEPIHNGLWLYTIEFGVIGLLFFIYFYYKFFCNEYKKLKNSYARSLLLTILVIYTMFIAFDHFLYY